MRWVRIAAGGLCGNYGDVESVLGSSGGIKTKILFYKGMNASQVQIHSTLPRYLLQVCDSDSKKCERPNVGILQIS